MALQILQFSAALLALLGVTAGALFPSLSTITGSADKNKEILQKIIPQSVIDQVGSMVSGMSNTSGVVPGVVNEVVGPTVKFYLYTSPSNTLVPEVLKTGDLEGLKATKYDPSKPVKFLVHGWMHHPAIPVIFPWTTKDAYFQAGLDYNVIVMDYTLATGFPAYPLAVTVTLEEASQQASEFLSWLSQESLIDLSQTHIIGLCIGAHIGGAIGQKVKATVGQPVARVTGLDPAGPLFYPRIGAAHVLSPTDASYVDVIHTEAPIGVAGSIGQADFYVNGGVYQPGCFFPGCGHMIAGFYYDNTIRQGQKSPRCSCSSVVSYATNPTCCSSQVAFGEYSKPGTKGTYYLTYTAAELVGMSTDGVNVQ